MAQFGTSLSAVSSAGAGTAVTPTNPFANCSMVLSGSAAMPAGIITPIQVSLEVSWDGTTWVTAGSIYYGSGGGRSVNVPGCPGVQLRANVLIWPAGITGTLSAVVGGV